MICLISYNYTYNLQMSNKSGLQHKDRGVCPHRIFKLWRFIGYATSLSLSFGFELTLRKYEGIGYILV